MGDIPIKRITTLGLLVGETLPHFPGGQAGHLSPLLSSGCLTSMILAPANLAAPLRPWPDFFSFGVAPPSFPLAKALRTRSSFSESFRVDLPERICSNRRRTVVRSFSRCSGVSGPDSVAAMIPSISLTSTSMTVGFSFLLRVTAESFHSGRVESCLLS